MKGPLATAIERRWLRAGIAAGVVGGWQVALSLNALHREITTDESFTMFTVGGGLHELARGIRSDPGMPFYYAPLYLVQLITGDSIEALRWVSLGCWLLIAAIVCWWAAGRGRALVATVLLIAFGSTRAMRESIVDARAAVPIALAALGVVALLHRGRRSDGRGRWHLAAFVMSVAVAWAHPSAVGVGSVLCVGVVWSTREHAPQLTRRLTVALLIPALAVAVDALSTTNFPPTGLDGFTSMGNQFFASSWLFTLGVVILSAVMIWSQRTEYALSAGAAAAYIWFAGLFAMLWLLDLFLPRYFVIAFTLIVASLAITTTDRVRTVLVAVVGLASLAGSLAWSDTPPEHVPRWCTTATALNDAATEGDTVIFAAGGSRTPALACLGREQAAALAQRVTLIPAIEADELDDPRTLWTVPVADLDGAIAESPSRAILVWNGDSEAVVPPALENAERGGRRCTTEAFGSIRMTTCIRG